MNRTIMKAGIVLGLLLCQTVFAAGALFTVTGNNSITIRTTVPNKIYSSAGIKVNTPGYRLSNLGFTIPASSCTQASNGFCLFSVSDTTSKVLAITGPTGVASVTLCLNGDAALSCQNYSLNIVQPT